MKSSRLFTAIIVLVAVLTILIGCRGQPTTPEATTPPTSEAEPSSPGEDWVWSEAAGKYIRIEDGTWIWRGFHHEFENDNHRFKDLQSAYYAIQYDFDPTTGKSELTGKVFGEQTIPVSDKLNYYTIKKGIKTGVAEFRYGTMDTDVISGKINEHIEMAFPQEISLDGLEKYDNVTIFMRGFSFDEVGSQSRAGEGAYPIRCFGLWVDDIQRQGSVLKLNLHVILHTSAAFLVSGAPYPWEYIVSYKYTLVGGNDGEFCYHLNDKPYDGASPTPGLNPINVECERVSEYSRKGMFGIDNFYEMWVVAFRGFYIQVNHDPYTDGPPAGIIGPLAREVRTVDMSISERLYQPEGGYADCNLDIYLCNRSAWSNPMFTYYKGFLTLLQFQDDQWSETSDIIDAGNGIGEGIVGKEDGYKYDIKLEPFSFQIP